jgi:hypothetical protein
LDLRETALGRDGGDPFSSVSSSILRKRQYNVDEREFDSDDDGDNRLRVFYQQRHMTL